jgi:flagella basal body P-ring formation protein FlgA
VPGVVETAARQQVARWAEAAGLSEPQIGITVVPGTRPLAACSQPVTVQGADTRLPARMRFIAVCAGANGWRYEFIVRAQVSARIAVMASELAAGKVLADEDVLLERHDMSGINDSIADPQDAVGMSAKRALRSGEILRKGLLSSPTWSSAANRCALSRAASRSRSAWPARRSTPARAATRCGCAMPAAR